MNSKSIIAIAIGAVALIGGGFAAWKLGLKKDEDDFGIGSGSSGNSGGDSGGSGGSSSGNSSNSSNNKPYKMGYVAFRAINTEGKNFVPHLAAPRPPKGTIKMGNSVKVKGTGKYDGIYEVNDVWIDSNGKLGALYLYNKNVIENNPTVRTWEDKAEIVKI